MTPTNEARAAELARINAEIAQRIRVEMTRQRIGPKALSGAAGINLGTLKRRLGRFRPTSFMPHELIAIGRVLGVDHRDFLPGREDAA